jgi:hypothetical protein
MDGWTIGTDIATMLTDMSVLTSAGRAGVTDGSLTELP